MSFPANYDSAGFCPAGCGSRIHAGDIVTYDEDDQLVHVGCVPRILRSDARCLVCGREKPCRCDD